MSRKSLRGKRGRGEHSDPRMCSACGKRKALFYRKGSRLKSRKRVGYSADHDLCPQCFEAMLNRLKAERLEEQQQEQQEQQEQQPQT